MSEGLNPTTVAVAGPVMAAARGLRWPEDRTEVVTCLNRVREYVYSMYGELEVPLNAYYCLCISSFPQRCGDDCYVGTTYQGFTLPPDMQSIDGAWVAGQPMDMRSKWRESLVGLGPKGPLVETFEMGETFATERPMDAMTMIKVGSERDTGTVRVTVVDYNWKVRDFDFVLQPDGWACVPTPVREIRSVALPTGRTGAVTLAQEDGRVLSVYGPSETVPNYKRYKVAPHCLTDAGALTILVQGPKRYVDVYDDSDIVEVGSRLVLEAGGRYLKYGEETTEPNEIKRANLDRANMLALLRGQISRQRGGSDMDGTPFRGRPLLRHVKTLPGYRR